MSNPVGASAVYGKTTSGSNAAVGVTGVVSATGTLTLSGNAVAAETVTIGGIIYTWSATVNVQTSNLVKIGGSASDSIDNLIAAINKATGDGTLYSYNTAKNLFVTAAAGAGDTMVVTAIQAGADGNGIATTETMTSGSWGAVTLTGGVSGALLTSNGGSFVGAAQVTGIQETRTATTESGSVTVAAGALSVSIFPLASFAGTILTVPWAEANGGWNDASTPGNTLPAYAITRSAGTYVLIVGRAP